MGVSNSFLQGPCLTLNNQLGPVKNTDLITLEIGVSLDTIRKHLDELQKKSMQKIESLDERLERYIKKLQIPGEHLKKMVASFVDELIVGLNEHKKNPNSWDPKLCSFKMIDACVLKLPTGNEKGTYYALDFGGQNFRIVRADLLGNGKMDVSKYQCSLVSSPKSLNKPYNFLKSTVTATEMFDFFAQRSLKFIKEQGVDPNSKVQAGFTFSFPCRQKSINDATLINWTKGFETGRQTDDPVEGLNVAELMNIAFHRNCVPAQCNSVLNDTVGTLLSCAYSFDSNIHPPCVIGMILGSGMNCCYYEDDALSYGYKGKIINIECGNFNRDLPRTNIDCELDFKAVDNRGFQQTEKMVSGAYLGEITRLSLVRILAEKTPPMAWQAFSLSAEKVAQIMNDKSKELIVTFRIMVEIWNIELPLEILQIIHRVAVAVMDRAASIAAVLVAGCALKSGRLQPAFGGLTAGVDGSLYRNNQWFREQIRHYLNIILGNELSSLIHLVLADDGSGKGAAILAATLVN